MNTVCSQDDAGEGQGLDVFSSLIFRLLAVLPLHSLILTVKFPLNCCFPPYFSGYFQHVLKSANSCHVKFFICHVYVREVSLLKPTKSTNQMNATFQKFRFFKICFEKDGKKLTLLFSKDVLNQ